MRSHSPSGSTTWVHAVAIAMVCVGLYWPAMGAPFVFDDLPNITHNPFIRVKDPSLSSLRAAAFESPSPRPFANLTFGLNYAACGYDVSCYRAVNVAIHVGNGWLVYWLALVLLRRLGRDETRCQGAALLAALVFVAHPIQTQSVTYVVQRMTSLATLLYLGSVLLFLRGRSTGSGRGVWFAASAAAGALAFASKQIAVTLPLALLLIEWQFFQDASREWLRRKAGLLAGISVVGLVLGVAYLALLGFPGYEDRPFTMGERALTQLRVVAFYVGLLLWPLPSRLNLAHAFPVSTSLLEPVSTLFAAIFLAALLGVGWALARRERLLSFAILWFFLQLVLESSILPLDLVYEHRLYLPMFGVALLVGDGAFRIGGAREWRGWVLGGALVAVLAIFAAQRNAVWGNAVRLWSDVVSKSPLDERAQLNLAYALRNAGRLEEAERHFEAHLREAPSADAHNLYAMALEWRDQPDRALEHFATAERLAPHEPAFTVNRALVLAQEDRVAEALELLRALVLARPDYAKGHFTLARVLESSGRAEEAMAGYRQAIALDPDYNAAHLRLARLLFVAGRLDEAAVHAREALRINPDQAPARELIEIAEQSRPSPGSTPRPTEPRTRGSR